MSAVAVADQATPPSIVAGTDQVLAAFERAIRDPQVDVGKMKSIMDMHRQIREEKAEEEFSDALVAVKSELPRVYKDAKNNQTNSTYARLETISAAVDPIIAKHGISLSFSMSDSPLANHYRIACEIRRKSFKATRHVDVPVDGTGPKGNANKSQTHAAGSTLSYGRRYLKLMIFDIALSNEDDDGNGGVPDRSTSTTAAPVQQEIVPATISEQQIRKIREALAFSEWKEADFLAEIKLPNLSEIYANMFGQALKLILTRSVDHVH